MVLFQNLYKNNKIYIEEIKASVLRVCVCVCMKMNYKCVIIIIVYVFQKCVFNENFFFFYI